MRKLFALILVFAAALGLTLAQETSEAQEEGEATVARILAEHPDLSTFYGMLEEADLLASFDDPGAHAVTLFAPSNAAFEALSEEEIEVIRSDLQSTLLAHHVAQDPYTSEELEARPISEEFTFAIRREEAGNLMINEAQVIEADLIASNGIVHIIDRVLALEAVTSEQETESATDEEMTDDEGTTDEEGTDEDQ